MKLGRFLKSYGIITPNKFKFYIQLNVVVSNRGTEFLLQKYDAAGC